MGLKKYIVSGLVFLILLGVAVYSLHPGSYTQSISNINITLPVAVWMMISAFLLYLVSIFHMMFYGTVNFAKLRKIKKDSDKFAEASKQALLGKNITAEYKSDVFKFPGTILPLLNSDPNKAAKHRIYDDDIQDILEVKEKLNNGEVLDLSRFSLLPSNPLSIQNIKNKLVEDPTYATEVLKKCEDESVCQKAGLALASYASLSDLEKFEVEPTKEILNILIDRIGNPKNSITLSNSQIISYLKSIDRDGKTLVKDDFIDLAKKLRSKIMPDTLVNLFETLSHEFPYRANEGYLYILFELQMIEKARDFLDNSSEDEFLKFRYLLFLKDNNRNFDTELFI